MKSIKQDKSMNKDLFYIYQIKQGDITVFSKLIEKYKDMAFNIAFQICRNKEDAEEVAQDSFVKVYKSLNDFKENSKFSTWLYTIVYRTAISKTRKKYVTTVDIEDHHCVISDTQEQIIKLKHNEQKQYIEYALKYLNPEDRTIINLYYLESNSINEISKIIGMNDNNIKIRLYRARKQMYSKLKELLKEDVKSIL